MSCKKILCMGVLIALVACAGCARKAGHSAQKKAPEAAQKSPASDSTDVFKEFYSDDTSKAATAKKPGATATAKSTKHGLLSSLSATSYKFLEDGKWVVQIACVQSQSLAEKMISGLQAKKYRAYIAEVQSPAAKAPGTWYRVRIGGFPDFASAKSFGESELAPAGFSFWVDKKGNDNMGTQGLGEGEPQAAPQNYQSTTVSEPAPAPAPAAPVSVPKPAVAAEQGAAQPAPAPSKSVSSEPTGGKAAGGADSSAGSGW